MKLGYTVILIWGIFFALPTAAQKRAAKDSVIKGATIEITQSYKPEVTHAPRPEPTPTLPPIDTSAPKLQYNVPQQTLFFSYGSLPLRPLALNILTADEQFANYVKLGGGNLSTLLLDAGIGSLRGENYETAIRINHLSQSGNLKNQKVSLTGVDAEGSLHKNAKTFGARLGIHNNRYHYYGYDHNMYSYPQSAVRQAFTTVELGLDMKNETDSAGKINYHPNMTAYSFSESNKSTSENSFKLGVPVVYNIDSNLQLYAALNFTYTAYRGQNNNIFQLAPGIRFRNGIFTGHATIAPTIGRTGSFYILPDAEVNFTIPGTQFMFNAGWQGNLVQNSFRQLATQNPYISTVLPYPVMQTHTNEVFAGIKSNIGNHISFNGRVSWWQYNDLPLFINDTAGDGKNFTLLYDSKVNALGLTAGIRYQVAHTFSIGFSGQWMNFYNKSYPELWHTPAVRFTGDLRAQPIKKLTINAYLSFIDGIYALEKGNKTAKINPGMDIGVGAEYEIVKRVNIFVQANNLLNSRYQLWYGYEAFGFNIFGGARVKF